MAAWCIKKESHEVGGIKAIAWVAVVLRLPPGGRRVALWNGSTPAPVRIGILARDRALH